MCCFIRGSMTDLLFAFVGSCFSTEGLADRRTACVPVRILVLLCCLACSAWAQPSAVNGVLDLRAVNLAGEGPVRLDGNWDFYPGQLLAPAAFAGADSSAAQHFAVPASWNGYRKDGRPLDGVGVATFRIQVLPPKGSGDLALRIFDVHSAYRLWLNGKLISAKGVVGESAETEVADPSLDMPVIRADGSPLELVLEVSNHHYREGGVTTSILLGTEAAIRSGQSQRWALTLFFVGSMLTMGCYHLFYFAFRRSHTSPLYFGLYCLLWMGNFIASSASDWVIRLFFPEAPADWLQRIDSVCFFLSVPVGYCFFRSLFPAEFSAKILRVAWVFFGVLALLALIVPIMTLQSIIPLSYFSSLLLIVYCLSRLSKARHLGREGASFILFGFGILGLIAANDMLNDLQVFRSAYLFPVGMFFFIISQGFAFSLSLSRAFASVERLSADLEGRNLALEQEAVERARLEKEVVNISENERRCLSLDLHDGLCQELTAARLRCSVLERKFNDGWQGDAELAQISLLLDSSVNQAYELSRGLWPLDHDQPGMNTVLEDFCRRLAASSGITIKVRNLRACPAGPDENLIHLYRIAQEAINNAVRHAEASLIEVSIDCVSHPDLLTLRVRDDGVGFGNAPASTAQGGLGVRIMAHRARIIGGVLKIAAIEGGGTEVACRILCEHCRRDRTPASS